MSISIRLMRQGIIVWLIVLVAAPALAQPAQDRPQARGGAIVGRVRATVEELRLAEDQTVKIDAILDQAARDFREMAPNLADLDPADRRRLVDEFIGGVADKIRPVLTEVQSRQFDERIRQQRLRTPGAATQPQGDPAAFGPSQDRPGPLLERLRQNLEGLGLTDEQKSEIDLITADARQQVQQARRASEGDPQALREKIAPILNQTREKIAAVLTEEQREKLRETMQVSADAPKPDRPEAPVMKESTMKEPAMAEATMGGEAVSAKPIEASAKEVAHAFDTQAGAGIGEQAPPISLGKADGGGFALESLRGRVVLLVFGSYSSPSFRQRAVALERIKREYGNRISVIVIYTREAHPTGDWEVQRNKDEGVSLEQPADLEARVAAAKRARDSLKLSMPIAVDTMDDKTANTYGGGANTAVLVGRNGTILARQRWFEPHAMRRAIEDALALPATQPR